MRVQRGHLAEVTQRLRRPCPGKQLPASASGSPRKLWLQRHPGCISPQGQIMESSPYREALLLRPGRHLIEGMVGQRQPCPGRQLQASGCECRQKLWLQPHPSCISAQGQIMAFIRSMTSPFLGLALLKRQRRHLLKGMEGQRQLCPGRQLQASGCGCHLRLLLQLHPGCISSQGKIMGNIYPMSHQHCWLNQAKAA